jgi:hypothetical protein
MLEDDESLTVNLSVKFSPGQRKPVKVNVKISFPVEKVKENLEDEGMICNLPCLRIIKWSSGMKGSH